MSNRIQAWFEQMVRGMAAQEWKRAINPHTGRCVYRTAKGHKCGVGQVIPDNATCIDTNYTASFLKGSGRLHELGLGDLSEEEMSFLVYAKAAHDDHYDPERVRYEFVRLGGQFNLNWPSDIPQS